MALVFKVMLINFESTTVIVDSTATINNLNSNNKLKSLLDIDVWSYLMTFVHYILLNAKWSLIQ